ncbi:ABC transporter, periplasmic substrate-binding protein [Geobacter metallireducens GS-15]|uniref:ABC transporter, periplasmic substrate-binding protein n=1 Tax=Geobacter metallireducens (strain ATCC 53774 / DSM 7210 / GS-15) TaxID=269799 RepID=Q39UU7_GEOMG|nr:ABC transporter, periplasmic substrate-binding protein [Geobacter metallireducens GS-15]
MWQRTLILKRLIYILPVLIFAVCATPASAARKFVAAVLTSDMPRYKEAYRAFVKGLAAKGYGEGEVEFVTQTPNPDPISWANSVRKFSALDPDILVTFGAPATISATQEVLRMPIVFVDVYGPVETGISRSMTKAGGNLCGVSSKVPMTTLIKAMMAIRPVKTLGILYNSRERGSYVQMQEIKRLAAQQGFAVLEANVPVASGLDAALTHVLSKSDCLFVSESSVVNRGMDKVMHKAMRAKVPVISLAPDAAGKGALVSLEVSPTEQGQLAANHVAKILSGMKPGDLPILTPRKVDLVINLESAKSLDLQVPFRVLSLATKVIK